MNQTNKISYRVFGKYALFSDPVMRVGGEKTTYEVPTYQSLIGVTEAIYWKPTFNWYIDRVRIMKPIQTQSKSVKPLNYHGGNDMALYTYLYDVEYQVEAHYEWNMLRGDLAEDRNFVKHSSIAKRMLERGGKRDIFLGTRECPAYVEPVEFGSGLGAYDGIPEYDCRIMFHGFNYPEFTGKDKLEIRLDKIVMKNGVIEFSRPENCRYTKFARKMKYEKVVTVGNYPEELSFLFFEGGEK